MTRFGGADRGQTAFDFAVGMGVFLITVGFILTFIPGVFAPFNVGSGTDELVGDRVAATLTEEVLIAESGHRATLNSSCTVEFFNGVNSATDCRFDDSASLATIVGATGHNLNVTIRANGSIATIDGTDLERGPSPPDGGDISASQRMVVIGDTVYNLVVKVW